jgi:hypothetical protein
MQTRLDELRKTTNVRRLPSKAQAVVDGYLHITVDGAEAACPYHINPGLHTTNRALLGKGNPKEIEALARKSFGKYDMHVNGSGDSLRSFLFACGIGVDCSGFASWVLNGITETRLHGPLWKYLTFPGVRRTVVSRVRPVENISANLLTGHVNSKPVHDLADVRPGDLIRAAGWHHVVVVIETGLDKSSKTAYFQYAQSSCMYGPESGVRTGYAVIKKPTGSLLEQEWFDDYAGSPIEALIAEGGDDSRLVRLKALAD